MQTHEIKITFRSVISIAGLFVLMFSTFGLNAQYGKWYRDTTFHEIEFKKICFQEGNESLYAKGVLKEKTIIDGYPCYKQINMTKDGHVKFFILAEDFEVAGNTFRRDTKVHFRSNRDFLIHCLYEPEIQGYMIKKENYRRPFFMGSTNFQLYPDGKLKYFNPAEELLIQDVWCKPSAVRGGIHLYHDSKLKECTSAREQLVQGVLVGKNFTLKFNKEGKLIVAEKEKVFK